MAADISNVSPDTGFMEQPAAYTVADISRLLQIGRNQAYALCKSGAFKIIRVGTAIRVPRVCFEKWMLDQGLK